MKNLDIILTTPVDISHTKSVNQEVFQLQIFSCKK